MFTGIVAGCGTVRRVEQSGTERRLGIDSGGLDLGACRAGDSIAVAGVCLTMLAPGPGGFQADVSAETLARTTLGALVAGDRVNLETALTLERPLGGHLVSGHVDGTGRLRSRRADGRAERFAFELPARLARYIARKGSVCVDGVSLTVNETAAEGFTVCLIPHTLAVTTLGGLSPGAAVNIEVDLVARYLERLLASGGQEPGAPGPAPRSETPT